MPKRAKPDYLQYHSRTNKHQDVGRKVLGYQREQPAYLKYHSKTNKPQDVGRKAARRGAKPAYLEYHSRTNKHQDVGRKPRQYKRNKRGRFA